MEEIVKSFGSVRLVRKRWSKDDYTYHIFGYGEGLSYRSKDEALRVFSNIINL